MRLRQTQILNFIWKIPFLAAFACLSARGESHQTCLNALIEHGHFSTIEEAAQNPYVLKALNEIDRFQSGNTDAKFMTAEHLPRYNSYRIVAREQPPISKAKVVFVAIHGNGGVNSGPGSLAYFLSQVLGTGRVHESDPSQFYVEAPALPGAEGGPNREKYTHPQQVVDWLTIYLKDLRSQMAPDAKLVLFTRSSGADFGIKAAFQNEGLIDDVIAMSPTTTGTEAHEHAGRIADAEKGAIEDLSTNGSGVASQSFHWIMKMVKKSTAWMASDFRMAKERTSFWVIVGSDDKQVPNSENNFTSELARQSDGALRIHNHLGAHHNVFQDMDGYDPKVQAGPLFWDYLRERYLGIPPPDHLVTVDSFSNQKAKRLGGKINLGSSIPVTPKTLVLGFQKGFRFAASDIYLVSSVENAKKHNEEFHHGHPAFYIIAPDDLLRGAMAVKHIPGFSAFRGNKSRLPAFSELAKNQKLALVKADGTHELLRSEDFQVGHVRDPEEIREQLRAGRLVLKRKIRGQVYFFPLSEGNFDAYLTYIRLTGEEKAEFARQRGERATAGETPSLPPDALVHFTESVRRGEIFLIPEGTEASPIGTTDLSSVAQVVDPHRFQTIYPARYTELMEAARKRMLKLLAKPAVDGEELGAYEYVNPQMLREYVANYILKRNRGPDVLEAKLRAEDEHEASQGLPGGNILLIESGREAQTVAASELRSFMGDTKATKITFTGNPLSPASVRFHAWVKPNRQCLFEATDFDRVSEASDAVLNDPGLRVGKNEHFWNLMSGAKDEIDENGIPIFDAHSWLLPQELFHQNKAESFEVFDKDGKLIAGALLLHDKGRWAIDVLVDLRKPNGPDGTATSAKDNPALQRALFEALIFAFKNGAERVELERIRPQVLPVLGPQIVRENSH